MKALIQVIGVVITLWGILCLIQPGVLKALIEFFQKGKRLYLIGVVRFALAIIFFMAARDCDISWAIFVLGILFLVSGVLIFMLGPAKLHPMMEWYLRQSTLLLRFFGFLTLAIGVAIIYST